jgi:hypothetical protein
MKNISEDIELAIFDKPMNRDYYGCKSTQLFTRLNRQVMQLVWSNIGMHVDEDQDAGTRHQWYEAYR